MPVIAIVNRKGGSGKSTLATHLAAWCAHQGHAVMLGDVDKQQSSRNWLHKRDAALPAIAPWAINQNVLRVPQGVTHVILDTPGGLHGFDLARMVMFADVVIMPVCGSAFDRESAAICHAELMSLPRVISGRCKVASIGMRIDEHSDAGATLEQWAARLNLPFLGILRESSTYVQSTERGTTVFDMALSDALDAELQTDVQQWHPILDWLKPHLSGTGTTPGTEGDATPSATPKASAPSPSPFLAALTSAASAASNMASRLQSKAVPSFAARTASHATIATTTAAAAQPRQPAPITRIGAPRVLGVGSQGSSVLRAAATSAATSTPQQQATTANEAYNDVDGNDDLAHIPAFLKLARA